MQEQIEDIVSTMNRLYSEGRLDEVLTLFSLPLPVYTRSGLDLKPSREEIKRSLLSLLWAAREAGSVKLVHQIISIRPSLRNVSTVARVEWNYLDESDASVGSSDVNYYFGLNAQQEVRVFMVEYLKLSFPEGDLRRHRATRPPIRIH